MTEREDLAIRALATPAAVSAWSDERLGILVGQARAAGLLGRIAQTAKASGMSAWPAGAVGHLESAARVARAQQAEVRREIGHLSKALASLDAPKVLLKGAAYVAAGLPAAFGRVFSDIDVMVPESTLAQAESLLMLAGWMPVELTAYDNRYYREWAHELPPMEHVHRHTTLDVHHTILPRTSRLKPVASLLFDAARPLAGHDGLFVLAPPDMVLHSMTHLFTNDDMSHALRDLSDLDLLLRYFPAHEPQFWERLLESAQRHGLQRPLHYGLRHAHGILGTPIPGDVMVRAERWGPRWSWPMDWLWRRVLRSPHRDSDLPGRALALLALYLRGHWLRMPPGLLVRHLTVKTFGLHKRGALGTQGG